MDEHRYFSAENAPTIFALKERLFQLNARRLRQKLDEEEALKRLFLEAGGSAEMLGLGLSLSEQAMAGLIRGTEGEANLTAFRQRHLIKKK